MAVKSNLAPLGWLPPPRKPPLSPIMGQPERRDFPLLFPHYWGLGGLLPCSPILRPKGLLLLVLALALPPARAADSATDTAQRQIQAAYDAQNGAMARRDADGVLAFQAPAYQLVDANGQIHQIDASNRAAQKQMLAQALATGDHFTEETTVTAVSLDGSGGATVYARDRVADVPQTGPGTQTDSQFRDFWTHGEHGWLLARRRVLSAQNSVVAGVQSAAAGAGGENGSLLDAPPPGSPALTAEEAGDPVYGLSAPQSVSRYTFGGWAAGARPILTFKNIKNGKSASRSIGPGQTPDIYARAFAQICADVGVQARQKNNIVYVTDKNGIGLTGYSGATYSLDTIRK